MVIDKRTQITYNGIMKQLKEKPYFDKQENWYIPTSIVPNGLMKPQLTVKEWVYFLLIQSNGLPNTKLKEKIGDLCGSRATIWRIKKSLKIKGYYYE